MPNQNEILDEQLSVVALLNQAVSGSKLKAAEVTSVTDFLNGLQVALTAHAPVRYVVYECAREIVAKAVAVKAAE